MNKKAHVCPTCRREFKSVLDYPRVRILSVERLPTPEAVDDMSDAAAQKALERHRNDPADTQWSRRRINMTPAIQRACESRKVAGYLDRLSSWVGKTVAPDELLPTFDPDRVFKHAYPVPETEIFLGLSEGTADAEDARSTQVMAMCRGPNLGSAGGPTLMHLGPIARIRYVGALHPAQQG